MATSKITIDGVTEMDVTQNTVDNTNLLSPNTATKNDGTSVTGGIITRSSSDVSKSGATVIAPAGYYPTQVSKSISNASVSLGLDYPEAYWSYSGTTSSSGYLGVSDRSGNYSIPPYSYFSVGDYYTITINGVSETIQATRPSSYTTAFTSSESGWRVVFDRWSDTHDSGDEWGLYYYTPSTAVTFSIARTYGTLIQPYRQATTAGYVDTQKVSGNIYEIPGGNVTITKTLQPKNLIGNGNFSAGRDGWSFMSNATVHPYLENCTTDGFNIKVISAQSSGTYPYIYSLSSIGQSTASSQIYYCQVKIKGKTTNTSFPSVYLRYFANGASSASFFDFTSIDELSGTALNDGNWHTLSYYFTTLEYLDEVSTVEYVYDSLAFGIDSATTLNDEMTIKEIFLVNLTDIYGSGDEPTKEWCDTNLTFYNTQGGVIEDIAVDSNTQVTYNIDNNLNTTTYYYLISGGALENSTDLNYWTQGSSFTNQVESGCTTLTLTTGSSSAYQKGLEQNFSTTIIGQTYSNRQLVYIRADIKGNTNNTQKPSIGIMQYRNNSSSQTINYYNIENDGEWHNFSKIWNTYDGTDIRDIIGVCFGFNTTSVAGDKFSVKNVIALNLTEIFGIGREPSKEWCDKNIDASGGISPSYFSPSKIIFNNEPHIDLTQNCFNNNALFNTASTTSPTGYQISGYFHNPYQLLATAEFTVNTTSTTATSIGTIALGSSFFTSNKIIYVKVRDKAGPRAGYFVGTDSYIFNFSAGSSATTTVTAKAILTHRKASGGAFTTYVAPSGTIGYGVYPYSLDSSGDLLIYRRYNSTYTPTLNGTYVVEVYTLDYAGIAGNPFNYSAISY